MLIHTLTAVLTVNRDSHFLFSVMRPNTGGYEHKFDEEVRRSYLLDDFIMKENPTSSLW